MTSPLRIRDRLDHRLAQANLSAYLDGEVTGDQKRRLERHLAICPGCREELASLRDTVMLLQQAPLRSVPRSFALPMELQAEQARNRRWNLTYSYLRGATVVATFLLVLLVSGDALIGMGAIPIPDAAPRLPKAVAVERVPEAPPVVEAVIEREVAATAPPTKVVTEKEGAPTPAPEGPRVELVQGQPSPAALASPSPVAEADLARGGGAPPDAAAVLGASPSIPRLEDTGLAAIAPSEKALATGRGLEPTSAPSPTLVSPTAEPPTARPTPVSPTLEPPTATPTQVPVTVTPEPPTATPTQVPVTVTPEPSPTPAKVAALAPRETEAKSVQPPMTQPLSPIWTVWRGLRVLWGLLAGLLLILLASTIWAGHRRRP